MPAGGMDEGDDVGFVGVRMIVATGFVGAGIEATDFVGAGVGATGSASAGIGATGLFVGSGLGG